MTRGQWRRIGLVASLLAAFVPNLSHAQTTAPLLGLTLQLTQQLPPSMEQTVKLSMPEQPDRVSEVLNQATNCVVAKTGHDILRLSTLINSIICNRAGVREGTGLTEQARAVLEITQGQGQPSLGLTAGIDAERGAGSSRTVALRMEWVLFDFGSTNAAVQQSRFALAAVLDNQRAEVLLVLTEAAQLYAVAKTAFGRLDTAAINLRSAQDGFNMTEARRAGGAGSVADKLQAQTALAQTRLEHVRSKSQWTSASAALAIAMGLRAEYPLQFELADDNEDAFFGKNVDIKELIEEARNRHPRITAARARLAEAQARTKSIDAERWGNITFNAVAGRIRSSGYTDLRDTGTASVLWTLPLLDKGVLAARQRDAIGQLQVRNVGVDDALAQVELQVWQQGQALISDREILRESLAVLNSAELSWRVSAERYKSGMGSFNDVLTAQNVAANARFQWIEAQTNLLRSQLKLAAAVGRFGPLEAN